MPKAKRLQTTPYQKLVADWCNCTKCPLHSHRKSVVFCRGSLPCDILFIGEAPGDSEDVLGKPFIGPAGKLLDDMIADALHEVYSDGPSDVEVPRLCFCNLVGCIPKDDEGKGVPSAKEIDACAPRLDQIIKLAKPQVVVAVGELAAKWATKDDKTHKPWEKTYGIKLVSIQHPAYLLRLDKSYKDLAIQRAIINLVSAVQLVCPF